jgi:predicted transcriptional regulator
MSRATKSDDNEDSNILNKAHLLKLTTEILCAYLANNRIPESELTALTRTVFASLASLSGTTDVLGSARAPAVPIKKSVTDDFIICLEDGKKLRTLKRYLRTQYQMSIEDYRAQWQLPRDYPMVAPSYTRLRSAFATKIGLGQSAGRRGRRARTA